MEPIMVFEHIENLKNTYTDKNVLVDADRPELGRFQGLTGTVRTVNMSGRALVEFDGHKNIGWFDIDVDFLKLVDKPAPAETPAASPAAKKPDATAKPDAAPTDPSKMNVADMLAAARGESAAPTAAEEPAAEEEKPTTVAADPASMSVADMLAAARGESAAPTAAEEVAEEVAEEEPAADNGGDEVQALKEADDAAGMCAYCRKVDA
jgi:hypothetical protein